MPIRAVYGNSKKELENEKPLTICIAETINEQKRDQQRNNKQKFYGAIVNMNSEEENFEKKLRHVTTCNGRHINKRRGEREHCEGILGKQAPRGDKERKLCTGRTIKAAAAAGVPG